jgi:transcriptional regulator with XRE-family HTH domain
VDETFGQLVRRLRERERWTQEKLAEKSGLDQSTISAIERVVLDGKARRIIWRAEAVAQFAGCD